MDFNSANAPNIGRIDMDKEARWQREREISFAQFKQAVAYLANLPVKPCKAMSRPCTPPPGEMFHLLRSAISVYAVPASSSYFHSKILWIPSAFLHCCHLSL